MIKYMKITKNQKKHEIKLVTRRLSLIMALAITFTLPIKAQVNIGSLSSSHPFSILELTTTANNHGGLRMPQLNNDERAAVQEKFNENTATAEAAKGLVIYNTDTKCLEFWNGKEWISMCADILDCSKIPALESSYSFCSNENATIANLTSKAGGNVQWRLKPGEPLLTDATPLTADTYYAYRNIPSCNILESGVPVAVNLVNCNAAPVGAVTAFVNVMYDFQRQTLEAYSISGGDATSWQWELSPNNSDWTPISGATSATYQIPENFIHNYSNYNAAPLVNDTVYFRCWIANPAKPEGTYTTYNLGIEFIRTTDGHGNLVGNYGKDENGVRYLTINRGGSLNGGKMKIALLNLGQSGTGSLNPDPLFDDSHNLNDAGDLGDLYQWGRVADGHEHIVWKKGIDHIDSITPMTGNGATSLFVARDAASQVYDSNGQIVPSNTGFYGNFICAVGDWGQQNTSSNYRWGMVVTEVSEEVPRSQTPTSISDWVFPANNPCPSGWRVPSRFELWDIYRGDGSTDPVNVTTGAYDVSNTTNGVMKNTWRWRDSNSPSNTQTVGGAVITNSSGEKVFLPAAGSRLSQTGAQINIGSRGYYWSSTLYGLAPGFGLSFTSSFVNACYTIPGYDGANGFFVRCITE